MSNPKRGEIRLKLGDKEFKGRVTLDVMMRIETAVGKGIVKIAQSMQEADVSVTEIVAILTPVIRAGGNNVTDKDIGNALFDAGIAEGMRCCAEVLASVLTSGGDEGNEEQAEALI